MPLEIVVVPCLSDNYAYLVHDPVAGATAVVDTPDAAPIQAELKARGWKLTDILLTHHHQDHIAGVAALRRDYGARVVGAAADAQRLPPLDLAMRDGDGVVVGSEKGTVLDVSGHTLGHIAYHFPDSEAVFTGDSLMALGCGRLFEGDAATMWASLSKLAALPPSTQVYSGHEYAEANARFALTVERNNPALQARAAQIAAARTEGRPNVPVRLSEELATNPFLRAKLAKVKQAIGQPGCADVDAFAEIRARKDRF
ncbi:hydroxyacylglutathione hydrolase [Rhodovulum adriaticum]|uniref:Hydroxyacylglutathione hydrolase n=1 Tax=Rhodovulum adriaticum TaxID=35804 RepID=A0A4V2SL74_RHOAD|nr:hydroxyacylglutathione hydrolase [Rhodovulum adriaticum]MBK1635163.1 hydroxyacylglutathione hydrolase [Rhodovulum adriaticum]TCP22276.1 hydroxyacylglutathione hydrolase [Rhodovulum adriaticum]